MSWNAPRAKVQLRLAIQRIKLVVAKKMQLAKTARREVGSLLAQGQLERARIKTETVMADDVEVELYELLELYCEMLLARFGLLDSLRTIEPALLEPVTGIIYAGGKTEVREVGILREMLVHKFGKEWSLEVVNDTDGIVPARIKSKLSLDPPNQELIDLYMSEIGRAYGVDLGALGLGDDKGENAEEESPTTVAATPQAVGLSTATTTVTKKKTTEETEYEALKARFDALKRL